MELEEKIVETASQMFLDNGIRAVSMDMVSQSVGISKRTLYEVFASKDELMVKCFRFFNQKRQQEFAEIWRSSDDFMERIVSIIYCNIINLRKINPLFFQDVARYHTNVINSVIIEEREMSNRRLKQFLEIGVGEGYIRSDLDLDLVCRLMHEHQVINSRSLLEGLLDAERCFRSLFTIILRGLCTIRGVEKLDKLMDERKI